MRRLHGGSHYTMFSGFLRNLESHACLLWRFCDGFSYFPHKLTASLFIAFWYRSFIFLFEKIFHFQRSRTGKLLLLEVTAETGLWYGLIKGLVWYNQRKARKPIKGQNCRFLLLISANLGDLEHCTSPKWHVFLEVLVENKKFYLSKRALGASTAPNKWLK